MSLQSLVSTPLRTAATATAALFLLSRLIRSALRAKPKPPAGAVVLVTGCDSGIGNATVKRLASVQDNGVARYKVLGGCFTEEGVTSLAALGPNVVAFRLDVTNQESIEAMRKIAEKECGENGLFALFNVAGIFAGTYNDLTPVEEWKKVFEVNVFGLIRVTQAVYHLVHKFARNAKIAQAQGQPSIRPRILFVTSVAAVMSAPGTLLPASGAYSASKHAARSFATSLRCEAKQFGIDVIEVQPFFTATGLYPNTDAYGDLGIRKPIAKAFGDVDAESWKSDPTGAVHPANRYKGGLEGIVSNGIKLYTETLNGNFKPAAEVADRMVIESEEPDPARVIYTTCSAQEWIVYNLNAISPESVMGLFEAVAGMQMAPLLPEKPQLEGAQTVVVKQAVGEKKQMVATV